MSDKLGIVGLRGWVEIFVARRTQKAVLRLERQRKGQNLERKAVAAGQSNTWLIHQALAHYFMYF